MRYSEGNEGIAISISNYAVDYLKVQYLPYLYSKVEKFDLPEFKFKHGLMSGTFKTTVTIPEPEQVFINNWETQFVSSDNSLRIANSH